MSNLHPIVYWNQIIQNLALKNNFQITDLIRACALVHISIYDALLRYKDEIIEEDPQIALISGVSSEVLLYLFSNDSEEIIQFEKAQFSLLKDNKSIIYANFGHEIGKHIVQYAKSDGNVWDGKIPKGVGKWSGNNPTSPTFGKQRLFFIENINNFKKSPLLCGSSQDLMEIQTVLEIHNRLTSNQIYISHKWSDNSPSNVWNNMLNYRIMSRNQNIFEAAKASAFLNAAMYDACVLCWHIKYTYWTARPIMRIPNFKPIVITPNSPSYISEHATLSICAAMILGYVFPSESNFFISQAKEASISCIWAGINFPQDTNYGNQVGEYVGETVLKRIKEEKGIILSTDSICRNYTSEKGSEIIVCMTGKDSTKKKISKEFKPSSLGNSFYNNTAPPKYGWRMKM